MLNGVRIPLGKPRRERKRRERRVVAPAASGFITTPRAPRLEGNRVRHRELIYQISSPGNDVVAIETYAINPGLPTTFPWLSKIAVGYEHYRFNKLSIVFQTVLASSKYGALYMSPEYDPRDPAPTGIPQMLGNIDSVTGPIWSPSPIRCSLKPTRMFTTGKWKFIRSNQVTGDLREYDAANINLAAVTNGGQPTICGNIWVDYDVSFHTPQIAPSIATNEVAQLTFNVVEPDESYQTAGVDPAVSTVCPGLSINEDGTFTIEPGQWQLTQENNIEGTSDDSGTINILSQLFDAKEEYGTLFNALSVVGGAVGATLLTATGVSYFTVSAPTTLSLRSLITNYGAQVGTIVKILARMTLKRTSFGQGAPIPTTVD